jgi:response regulator RpfG family c-di-GMP phosphodiesterase/putative methionine-R-sulfoxide reductase with GAF domain
VENKPLKILAIDDNTDNLLTLKAVIKDAFRDAKFFSATSGQAGIELARQEDPTIILLDIVMPGMDGYAVTRIIKSDERLKHIPIIFLTALKTDKKSRIKALEMGADAFLPKPFDETELIAQLRAMARIHASVDRDKQEKEQLSRLVEERTQAIESELVQRRKAEVETQEAYAKLKQNQLALLLLMEEMKDEITARKKAEENLQQRLTELEILADFSRALSQLMTPEQIGQKIIDLFEEKLDWHHIAIRQYQPNNDTLKVLAFTQPGLNDEGVRKATLKRFNTIISKPGEGLSGWVWQQSKLVNLPDVTQNEHYLETYPGIRSGLYAPLQAGDRTIGVISLESEQPQAFSQVDERMLTTLAAQASVALENARLYEQTATRLKNIESLRQIDRAISASFDIKSTLAIITETARNQLDVSAVVILLYNPQAQMLEFAFAQGFRTSVTRDIQLNIKTRLANQVVSNRKMVQISDLQALEADVLPPALKSEGFVSYVGVPLLAKSKVNGVLEIYNRTGIQQEREWFDFLEAFAHQASIAINNAKLFDDLQRLNVEISLSYDNTIESWARTLEIRDPSSSGHAQRVMNMCVSMASTLGLDADSISQIRRGALLHDIGMLGLPETILFKPGELTTAEWEVVRQHPKIAFDLLAPLANWRQAVDISYCHHERWDGSGYPQGLKNQSIPLAARICSLVDVFDTLLMERSFRPAWNKAQATQYIRDGAGSQFDPDLVRIFLAMTRE